MPLDEPPRIPATAEALGARIYDTLIYQTLETTKASGLAENAHCILGFITSDTAAERESWMSE